MVAVLVVLSVTAACSGEDGGGAPLPDAGLDRIDAGGDAAVPVDPGDAGDTTAPSAIADLAGQAVSHTAVALTWSAPGGDGSVGRAAAYELRFSKAPITSEAELAAASVAVAPAPLPAGSAQDVTVGGLEPATTYHFAVRARDEAGNWGPIASTSAATKARASFLVSEIAPANGAADGYDFVELVATRGGWAERIQIRQASGLLHELAAFDVAEGDRVVIHVAGLPGPAGFAQEDTTKDKASSTDAFASAGAWDVYSASTGLTGTDNVVSVVDDGKVVEAVAYSNRDEDASPASMTAFAAARAAGQWAFAAAPADGQNDCATQREAVSVATADSACGGFPTGVAGGVSLNRHGVVDTNGKGDFYVAPQSPGAANAAVPAPGLVSATATAATTVALRFDQEIAPGSVAAAAFTIGGLAVSAAALSDVHVVTLTTATQGEGSYTVSVGPAVTNRQGVAVIAPPTRFCGYSPGALLAISEVNPNISNSADLVELLVTRGGPLGGMTLRRDPRVGALSGTLLATLPAICAATGDLVVVHLNPGAAPTAPASEVLAKNEQPAATYAANHDGAWDVLGGNTGLPYATDLVLAVRDAAGAYVEAAAFTDGAAGATTQTYRDALAYVQGLGLWMPADCGGAACSDATTPTARGVAASWNGAGTTPAGPSVRRIAPAPTAASFAVGSSSFGAAN